MPAIVVIGLQWGDEGKGKIVDLLADSAAHIVRSQGGNNAGHTVKRGEEEFAFHLIPSGILAEHATCYIGGGTLIDPKELLLEMRKLEEKGVKFQNRLFISPHAHLIFSFHRQLDQLYEKQKGNNAIGTTGRGIGPCVQDRAARIGIRIGELNSPEVFKNRLQSLVKVKNLELEKIFRTPAIDVHTLLEEYAGYGSQLQKYIGDVEGRLAKALERDENVLFEGAHGTLLDLIFGTVPFVTSSSTTAAGVCEGAGIGPTQIDEVLGVIKAYTTRVGGGPLPTTLSQEDSAHFLSNKEAREVGSTTGRFRRIGWFDGPMARYAVHLNGVDQLAVTKLDILDRLSQIKLCVAYRLDGEELKEPPVLIEDLERVQPIYETFEGWKKPTSNARQLSDLPKEARRYLDRIEELCGRPINILSVGPDRAQTLFLNERDR